LFFGSLESGFEIGENMDNTTSPAGTLTKTDLKKQLKAAIVWSIPMFSIWGAQILGAVQMPKHTFVISDLYPSQITIGAMLSWIGSQIQGLYLRWSTQQ
jgi:hypothetical protein